MCHGSRSFAVCVAFAIQNLAVNNIVHIISWQCSTRKRTVQVFVTSCATSFLYVLQAMQTIDGEMAPQLSQRRKLREGARSQFYEAATYAQGPFARVPEALRPKPGRLSIAQQRVYEVSSYIFILSILLHVVDTSDFYECQDFIRFPWQNQSAQNSSIMPSGVSGQSSGSTNPGLARVYTSSGQLNAVYPAAQGAQGFGPVAQQIDFIPEEIDHGSSPIMR